MSSTSPVKLGGTAAAVEVYRVGYGLMMMTWTPKPTPDEQAFEALKTAIDLTPKSCKLFINSGEFYGTNPRTANLELVARFFDKYPELADRTFLSVKGGTNADSLEPNSSEENLRRSVDAINKALNGKKRLDLFQCARVDPNISVEDTMTVLKKLQAEGKFDHVGVSEVAAATLKRALAVLPVAAVEIEISPWSYEEETQKVIAVAKEAGVAVIGYAPLGRGFLTGKLKVEELPEGDFRRNLPRFQQDAREANQKIVDSLTAIAERRGITTAQLSIAWVASLGSQVIPLPGSSRAERVKENVAAGEINFSEQELAGVNKTVEGLVVQGDRYGANMGAHTWG